MNQEENDFNHEEFEKLIRTTWYIILHKMTYQKAKKSEQERAHFRKLLALDKLNDRKN